MLAWKSRYLAIVLMSGRARHANEAADAGYFAVSSGQSAETHCLVVATPPDVTGPKSYRRHERA